MRKTFFLLIAVFFAVCASTLNVQAQTNVTSTYLANAGFDNSCNYLASTAASNLGTGAANNQTVNGWTLTAVVNNSASSAYEYGYTGTLNSPGVIPSRSSIYETGAGHGALGVSVAWAANLSYYQNVTLPAGNYIIEYAAFNSGPSANGNSRVGWVPVSGTSVLSTKTSFAQNSWSTERLSFTLAAETAGKIQVGLSCANAGSASQGRIFFDYVKLILVDAGKTTLLDIKNSATEMYNNQLAYVPSAVYTSLNSAIGAAQIVYDNVSATDVQILEQQDLLNAAITSVKREMFIHQRLTAWTTFPYNATSVIANPSFEADISLGWANPNAFARPNSTAMGAYKNGSNFVEKYVGSPGTQVNLNISQVINDIPNGIYRVTAGAQAIQQTNPATYPGKAYIFANADSTEVFIINNYTVQTNVTNNTLKIGFVTKTTGNWVALDNFQLSYLGDPKSVLNALIVTANGMIASPQNVGASTVYTDLGTAVSAAQLVSNNASATSIEITAQETAMNTAIANVNGAILLQTRKETWTTFPLNVTSAISNPSFEVSATAGWTNVGGFVAQNNTSFAFKAGTYYVEKWQSTGNWTGLRLSQRVLNIPNGIYNLTASALNEPNTTGGAFIFGNAVTAEVFTPNDYSVTVTVTNNELEIGYEVVNGGNYVGVDNFRLTYVSDGSPYVILNPTTLFLDPNNLTKTFTVNGGNLTSDVVLNSPSGIALDKTTLTAAEAMAGATVTATFDNATAITSGIISATCGVLTQNVTVNTSADLNCFDPLYPSFTNIIPNTYMNEITAFAGWGHKSVVFGEAYCGAGCVKFEATTNGYPDGAAMDVNNIAWEANSTYRLHAWVKAVDGTFAFFAKGTNPDVTISVPQNTEWVLIDQTFTTGAAPTANFFSFNNVDGASTGKIAYIDNYELYNITSTVTATNQLSANKEFRAYVADKKIVADFDLVQSSEVEFSVYNMQGMLISKEKATYAAGQNHKLINTNLPSGMYMVNMTSNGKSVTQKVVR